MEAVLLTTATKVTPAMALASKLTLQALRLDSGSGSLSALALVTLLEILCGFSLPMARKLM